MTEFELDASVVAKFSLDEKKPACQVTELRLHFPSETAASAVRQNEHEKYLPLREFESVPVSALSSAGHEALATVLVAGLLAGIEEDYKQNGRLPADAFRTLIEMLTHGFETIALRMEDERQNPKTQPTDGN